MTFCGTKLTFRLTLDSRGDKASPTRRGTSATEGAWQNRGSRPAPMRERNPRADRSEQSGDPRAFHPGFGAKFTHTTSRRPIFIIFPAMHLVAGYVLHVHLV